MSLSKNMQLYNCASEEELSNIIRKVGLTDIFLKNNGTFDSELTKEFEKDGIMLSAGEKQKVGLARIMSNNFSLLLLDEPSSTLDPIAEFELAQLLFNEANKTTTIIVSHRLSMVRDANCIYVMDKGTIKESGTHEELMNKQGIYYEMFTKQSSSFI